MNLAFDWSALAQATTGPGTGGRLRQTPADFQVQEIPAYLPAGEGEFLYLQVRKTGHTTAHVLRELCAQLGIKERDVGVAGLKDRHAVTTQWLSLPGKFEERLSRFALDGVELLEVTRHTNKLGMGHLAGNRFVIRVREAAGQAARAAEVIHTLARQGVPNYFGPQRFGLGGLNAEEGLRVLRGESRLRDPRVRRFLTSSVQSAVFNRFVSLRVERALLDAVVAGDMAKKHATGGVFMVEEAAVETPRARQGEISATGTLFGRKTKPLTLDAGVLEQEALDAFGLTPAVFDSRRGDRRFCRVFPGEVEVEPQPDGYTVTFSLPRGSFATSVLREMMKSDIDVLALEGDNAAETQEDEPGFGDLG